jgi:hypothetical protein
MNTVRHRRLWRGANSLARKHTLPRRASCHHGACFRPADETRPAAATAFLRSVPRARSRGRPRSTAARNAEAGTSAPRRGLPCSARSGQGCRAFVLMTPPCSFPVATAQGALKTINTSAIVRLFTEGDYGRRRDHTGSSACQIDFRSLPAGASRRKRHAARGQGARSLSGGNVAHVPGIVNPPNSRRDGETRNTQSPFHSPRGSPLPRHQTPGMSRARVLAM